MKLRHLAISLVVVLAIVAAVVVYRTRREQWLQSELLQADKEYQSRRFYVARKRLNDLAQAYPGRDEVVLSQGDCELALERLEPALALYDRIVPQSPEAPRAAAHAARALLGAGRFSAIEERLAPFLHVRGEKGQEAREAMILALRFEGRIADVRQLLKESWRPEDSPVETVRELWRLEYDPYPVDGVRDILETSARKAPDDDRVWLGLANLATRLGQFDEAAQKLDACLKKRPNDPVVWRARLEQAIASDSPAEVARSLPHIPIEMLTRQEYLALRAWLAARKGDAKAEKKALEELITPIPEDPAHLERLAELALRTGDAKSAAELRARKLGFEKKSERYRDLIALNDPEPHARELAHLAGEIGRNFDARCWWTLAARRDSNDKEAKAFLGRRTDGAPDYENGKTLADALRDVAPPSGGSAVAATLSLPDFRDDAAPSGLRFTFNNGRSDERQLPETMSGGLALIDYDGDGWLDVYVVQGGRFPPEKTSKNEDRLFRNQGDGTFRDVSAETGIAALPGGYGHGVTVGDFDNDGRPDLFVTRWRSYALLRNRGDGQFEDVTALAGLNGDRDWPTSAAFADFDGDGDLDLYVCHYLVWDAAHPKICEQTDPKTRSYCHPRLFPSLPDHLFRNDAGRFVDVTKEAGIVDNDGRGLGVVTADFDGDGRIDIFVANDSTANFLFRNLGGWKFEEIANKAGVAANDTGTFQAGMGIAYGDQNGDGLLDLAVTNFFGEGTSFFQNLGDGVFVDHSSAVGLLATTKYLLGFGVAFLDANNDGRLDLAATNGHVNDGKPLLPYQMPTRLWLGDSRGRLVDSSDRCGAPWSVLRLGRGLAATDLDNDGKIDLLILGENEPLAYFHNRMKSPGHFATFFLEGTSSNRDGIGGRVTISAAGRKQVGYRFGGGSYQSSNDPRLHFGIGAASKIDAIEVKWPSGKTDRFTDLPADAVYLLREGDANAVKK